MPKLLIVDDDELSREVLELLAAEAGFECTTASSGEHALELVAGGCRPAVVLSDMQMPGVCGDSLGKLLRAACAPGTVLLAMSGSIVPAKAVASFDGFLLKPFAMEKVSSALAMAMATKAPPQDTVLKDATFRSLSASMPKIQLKAMYAFCLQDALQRLDQMRTATIARDQEIYVRAAHAIKGSCGMVGATELARLAGEMESAGLPEVDNDAPFRDFLEASERLQGMLDAQSE